MRLFLVVSSKSSTVHTHRSACCHVQQSANLSSWHFAKERNTLGHFAVQWVSEIIGTLCNTMSFKNHGDSTQNIKSSAWQQTTEQSGQQQVNHQHIPSKACQRYSSHGPGINIDKGGEGGEATRQPPQCKNKGKCPNNYENGCLKAGFGIMSI